MTAPTGAETAALYYQAQAATAAQTVAALAVLWNAISFDDVDRGWKKARDAALARIIAGQLRAAALAPRYADVVLAAAGLQPDPIASVPATAFAGRSSTGFSLVGPLDAAPIRFKQSLLAGQTLPQAVASGLAHLTMVAATEVADAGRGAMETVTRLEPQIVGYERYVNLPSCGRCIILAGRIYRYSQGFLRHPKCDCAHRPLTSREMHGLEQEPSELFRSMDEAEQDRVFTKAGADAIRHGADLSQVVNARQGMSAPGDLFTTVGLGRGKKKRPSRLSPQGIARLAGADDDRYLELLRANNYIA